MPEGVAGDGLAAEVAHDEGLPGRLEAGVQSLTLAIKQRPKGVETGLIWHMIIQLTL